MLKVDIRRELARSVLPVGMYTEFYWQINLHNLLHFLQLRMDKHAQEEIREYALAVAEFVKGRCPVAWEAFTDYRLNAGTFSGPEMGLLKRMINQHIVTDSEIAEVLPNERERVEFLEKLPPLAASKDPFRVAKNMREYEASQIG